MTKEDERALVARASGSSQVLRSDPPPDETPTPNSIRPDRDVREGIAASAEIGLLVLQKMGRLEGDVKSLMEARKKAEEAETSALKVLLADHRSRSELHEEETRVDLKIKQAKDDRWGKILTRVVAALMTPPGLWALYEWFKKLQM